MAKMGLLRPRISFVSRSRSCHQQGKWGGNVLFLATKDCKSNIYLPRGVVRVVGRQQHHWWLCQSRRHPRTRCKFVRDASLTFLRWQGRLPPSPVDRRVANSLGQWRAMVSWFWWVGVGCGASYCGEKGRIRRHIMVWFWCLREISCFSTCWARLFYRTDLAMQVVSYVTPLMTCIDRIGIQSVWGTGQ
jgi:hypothetical protein